MSTNLENAERAEMTFSPPFSYVPMPLDADGQGPADDVDAVSVAHDVWDANCVTVATCGSEETARSVAALMNAGMETRIRSCLLDKPAGVEGEGVKSELAAEFSRLYAEYRANSDNDHGGAMREEIELLVMENLDVFESALISYLFPADTDAAQMQEVALARATAREDLFPEMSSRIKAEREQARRQAFDEVGKKAREYAAHYPEASDGRNTFIIFAEWAEGRAALLAAKEQQP